jgi:tetrahydrodipicolinate N-succinyltransferase
MERLRFDLAMRLPLGPKRACLPRRRPVAGPVLARRRQARVPAGSVVVSGNLPSKDGRYSLYCAVIVKQVDAKTRGKVGINELLRDI